MIASPIVRASLTQCLYLDRNDFHKLFTHDRLNVQVNALRQRVSSRHFAAQFAKRMGISAERSGDTKTTAPVNAVRDKVHNAFCFYASTFRD